MAKDKIFGVDVKKEETGTHSFVKTIVYSLNPGKYRVLVQRTWKQAFDYMFTLVFFLVFLLFLVSIFRFAQVQYGLDQEFRKFDRFELKADYELKEPIVFGNFLVMDNERNYTGEDILITQDGITSKSLLCILLSPACMFEKDPVQQSSSELKDVLSYSNTIKAYTALFLVLLLPGLLLLFLVFYSLKFLIIIGIASALVFIITRISRFEVSTKQIFLAAVYSSTILVLLEVVTYYIQRFYLVPMIAYIVMLTICIMLIGEREHAYTKEKQ